MPSSTAIHHTNAYVVQNSSSAFEKQELEVPSIGPNEVLVRMICSGLCHTDIHMQKNDWGVSSYPAVFGHEGVGIIEQVGTAVKSRKVGQKVGIGWIADSCEACNQCIEGQENICRDGYTGVYLADHKMGGTFANHVVIPARFAFPVPEDIPAALAAPLLCAGITVYSPLRKWVSPNQKVGIISVGGLGHLAIQFAKALGAEVTVFSTSRRKEADAKKLGATNFVVYTDEAEFEKFSGTMDVILNTCPYAVPLDGFIRTLAKNGVLCYLGMPESGEKDLKINLYSLIFDQKTLAGSIVGGSKYIMEMFEMVKKFGVQSSVEPVSYTEINEACDKLLKGDTNGAYRFVLCWDDPQNHRDEVDRYLNNAQ